MTTFWLIALGVALPFAVCGVLVAGMLAVDVIEWRRKKRIGELMEHLAKEGQGILERERR